MCCQASVKSHCAPLDSCSLSVSSIFQGFHAIAFNLFRIKSEWSIGFQRGISFRDCLAQSFDLFLLLPD